MTHAHTHTHTHTHRDILKHKFLSDLPAPSFLRRQGTHLNGVRHPRDLGTTWALSWLHLWCECECECVRVSNDRLRGLSARPLSSFSAHPLLILAANVGPLPGGPALPLGTPAGRGQSLVRCGHFGVPGAGWGAMQFSSSLQCQEEDGHGPPELWVGLAGGSTARHHHHCDRREKGHRPGLWSAWQGQGRARCPLSPGDLKADTALTAQTHS